MFSTNGFIARNRCTRRLAGQQHDAENIKIQILQSILSLTPWLSGASLMPSKRRGNQPFPGPHSVGLSRLWLRLLRHWGWPHRIPPLVGALREQPLETTERSLAPWQLLWRNPVRHLQELEGLSCFPFTS